MIQFKHVYFFLACQNSLQMSEGPCPSRAASASFLLLPPCGSLFPCILVDYFKFRAWTSPHSFFCLQLQVLISDTGLTTSVWRPAWQLAELLRLGFLDLQRAWEDVSMSRDGQGSNVLPQCSSRKKIYIFQFSLSYFPLVSYLLTHRAHMNGKVIC